MAENDAKPTSQPAIIETTPAVPDAALATVASDMSVNLHVVSPSLPAGPLVFGNLLSTTTIGQLKAKIRATLPAHPAPSGQRLIYLGRPLMEDGHTLLAIMGTETIRTSDKQTIHLVLRDGADADGHVSATATPRRGRSPVPSRPVPEADQAAQPPANPQLTFRTYMTQPQIPPTNPQDYLPGHHRPQPSPSRHGPFIAPETQNGNVFPAFRAPSPVPPPFTPQQLAQLHAHQHQQMSQWIQRLHQATMNNQAIDHHLRDRVAMGTHGIADQSLAHQHPGVGLGIRENVPVGPSGLAPQHSQATANSTTTNLATAPYPGQPGSGHRTLSPAEMLQNSLRTTETAMNAVQALGRSASSASLGAHRPIGQPTGASTPLIPQQSLSRAPSRRATPDITSRTPSSGSVMLHFQRPPVQHTTELYVLYSPEGPRAILYSNSETYHSTGPTATRVPSAARFSMPRTRSSNIFHAQPAIPSLIQQPAAGAHVPPQDQLVDQAQARREAREQRRQRRRQRHAVANPHGNNNNNNNNAIAVRLAHLWPNIWLVLRLALFFWAFGLPTQLWSRLLTVVAVALVILANIGALNEPVGQVLAHVRRHLEALLPLPEPPQNEGVARAPAPARAPAGGAGDGENANRRAAVAEPNPAGVAARLIREHRQAQANWALDAVRRAERLGLLFIASIAPGVAERHIGHLQAELRSQQRRREEAAAGAEAASATATAAPEAEQAEEAQPDPAGPAPPAAGDAGLAQELEAEPMPVIAL